MSFYPSYWERSILLRPFDFTILGAGLIGKQIAIKIKLKYPEARIALVDKYPLPLGASTRNAGFACFGSLSEILDDLNHSPLKEVMQLAEKRYRGIGKLIEDYGEEKIGYLNTGSTEIFDKNQSEDLENALNKIEFINEALKNVIGIDSVFEIKEGKRLKMNCNNTILFNKHEGMLNSGMLNESVSDKAHRLGIIPFYGFNVQSMDNIGNGYELADETGLKITCRHLIIANNAFASQLIPDLNVVPARGQIIITKPLENIPFNGIFHSDKGYIYFRNIDNRVLIGGGRNHFKAEEETYSFEGSESVRQYLENYLKTVVLPDQPFEIDMHWSGIMAMGQIKQPIVKRIDENLLVCVRMSGMGVALGPILSDEIAALV